MCAKENLRLHKFASNSRDVLKALPANDRAKDLKYLDLRPIQFPSKDLLAPTVVSILTLSDFVLNSETNLPPAAGFCQQLVQFMTHLEQYRPSY